MKGISTMERQPVTAAPMPQPTMACSEIGRVLDPQVAEHLVQVAADAVLPAVLAHVVGHQEQVRVLLHLRGHGLPQGVPVHYLAHSIASVLYSA